MKIIKYILTLFLASSLFIGCDQGFEEVNSNVDDPVIVPSSMLIGTVVRNVANQLYSTFNGSEIGETWTQHISLIQYNDPERYKPRISSMDGMWNAFYLAASDANQMYTLAEIEGNTVNQGIALTMKAYCFTLLTDFYGDVPFSEALLGPTEAGIFAPKYDAQSDIYPGIMSMLDEAITMLASGVGTTDPSMDILYAGDASKWLKFAGTLKFRSLMRISGKQDVSADLKALVSNGYIFTSNDEEAKVVFLDASPEANPLFETIVAGGRNEFKMGETFIEHLKNTFDPRLPVIAQPAVNSGDYVGKPAGFAESPLPGFGYDDVSAMGLLFLEPTAPGYFISYSELLFLMSEAALKGYISGGEAAARDYYNAGVTNSFSELGVAGAEDFLTQSGISFTPADGLKQIGTQKWVVLFCQGFESWTEWRRTGFPVFTPATDGYISEIPSRLKYESNEVSINKVNYDAAVAAQGADELTTPVWWMK